MIITGKKFSKPALSKVINGDTPLPSAPEKPTKLRLDHLLVQLHPEYNRSTLQTFIKLGFVKVDGLVVAKPNALVLPSALISLNIPPTEHRHPDPLILYEDANVLVLDKPRSLLSMPIGEYCREITLENYGLIVHRLDRDTSGVIILAKNPATQLMLRRQFQLRQTHKTYYAIIEGQPKLPAALIDLPIARNPKRSATYLVDPAGRPSQTYYRVLATIDRLPSFSPTSTPDPTLETLRDFPLLLPLSLVELHPVTGRTHQLRVHLRHLGTPILGDRVYSAHPSHPDFLMGQLAKTGFLNRLYLHATALEITIPNNNQPLEAENSTPAKTKNPAAPEIPTPEPPVGQPRTFVAPLPPEFSAIFPNLPDLVTNPAFTAPLPDLPLATPIIENPRHHQKTTPVDKTPAPVTPPQEKTPLSPHYTTLSSKSQGLEQKGGLHPFSKDRRLFSARNKSQDLNAQTDPFSPKISPLDANPTPKIPNSHPINTNSTPNPEKS